MRGIVKMSDKTSDKLLPCPFCGGEAYKYRSGFQFSLCEIICKDCGCRTERMAVEDAIAAWNTRKPMERIVERLEELREAEYDDSDEEPEYRDFDDIFDDGVSSGKFKAYQKAIEIVKGEK